MIVLHCPFQRDSSRYVCCSRAFPLDLSTQQLSRQRRRKNALLGDHYFANAKMVRQSCASCIQTSDRQFGRSQFSSTKQLIFIVLDVKRKAPKRSRTDGISFSARPLRATLALHPDRRGRRELPGPFAMRMDQKPRAGSQGGPLPQGCVAKAPTRGAKRQGRPSTERAPGAALAFASSVSCCEVTWLLRAMAGVASMAAVISAADRSPSLVIPFLHWIGKANTIWLLKDCGIASGDCRATEGGCYSHQ
jgi:hypothetical protein